MKNIFNLSKIYFKQLILQNFSIKSNKKRSTSILYTFLLVAILMGSVSVMLNSFVVLLKEVHMEQNILFLGLLYTSFITLFFLIYETQGYFFKNKDYELLAAMPIKSKDIIISKFLSVLLTAYVYEILFVIPTVIIYFMHVPFSIVPFLMLLVGLIFFPMIYIFIGSGVGALINIITSKLKHKNIINSIFMIIIIMVVFVVFSLGNSTMMHLFASENIPLALKIIFPSAYFLFAGVAKLQYLNILWLLLISIASIILTIYIINLTYQKVNTNLKQTNNSVSKKTISYAPNSVMKTLLKNEFKRWAGIPVYVVNTIIGPLMVFAMSIILGVVFKGMLVPGEFDIFALIYIIAFSIIINISSTTSTSISLEGKNFYILKSMPIQFKTIVIPKLSLNLSLSVPFLLMAEIIAVCILPLSWVGILGVLIIPILSVITFSMLGLLFNLFFPKLDWTSEIQVVKQSLSVFLSMITPMIFFGVLAGIYFGFLSAILSVNWFIFILFVLLLLVFITVLSVLCTKGKKLFQKLS